MEKSPTMLLQSAMISRYSPKMLTCLALVSARGHISRPCMQQVAVKCLHDMNRVIRFVEVMCKEIGRSNIPILLYTLIVALMVTILRTEPSLVRQHDIEYCVQYKASFPGGLVMDSMCKLIHSTLFYIACSI